MLAADLVGGGFSAEHVRLAGGAFDALAAKVVHAHGALGQRLLANATTRALYQYRGYDQRTHQLT